MLQLMFKKQALNLHQFLKSVGEQVAEFRNAAIRLVSFEEAETVEGQSRSFRVWTFSSFAALICILILNLQSKSETDSRQPAASSRVDVLSLVPDGYVLVPIEPINLDSIDAIFGSRGWADLFVERANIDSDFRASSRPTRRRIAVGVALVRAPRNPARIAALVKETDTRLISELGQPVHIALRKAAPKSNGESVTEERDDFKAGNGHLNRPTELVHEDGIQEEN